MKLKYSKYAVFAVIAASCIGCSGYLQRQLWFDESLTLLNFSFLPFSRIYSNYSIPNNHIGFTMLLKIWYGIAPDGVYPDIWCRFLVLLLAAGYILFVWYGFKKFTFRVAVASLALTAPWFIYATSVRGYMAGLLLSAAALKTAILFIRHGGFRNGLLFFLASLGSVAILPSNLFVLGASVIYAGAFSGKNFYKNFRIYLAGAIAIAAFFLFWGPILPQLLAAGRLGEGWHNRFESLIAGLSAFTACFSLLLVFAAAGFFCRRNSWRKYLPLLTFFPLAVLLFWADVAPFPRVYFPFFTVFMLLMSRYAEDFLAFVRLKKSKFFPILKIGFAVISIVAAFAVTNCSGSKVMLSKINGSFERDDYFLPWYIQKEHQPQLAALFLSKLDYPRCYLSFSSDPWSVMFYSALTGVDLGKFCFDGPRGRVHELPPESIAVINKNESAAELSIRFSGNFTVLNTTPCHIILRKN